MTWSRLLYTLKAKNNKKSIDKVIHTKILDASAVKNLWKSTKESLILFSCCFEVNKTQKLLWYLYSKIKIGFKPYLHILDRSNLVVSEPCFKVFQNAYVK